MERHLGGGPELELKSGPRSGLKSELEGEGKGNEDAEMEKWEIKMSPRRHRISFAYQANFFPSRPAAAAAIVAPSRALVALVALVHFIRTVACQERAGRTPAPPGSCSVKLI